MIELQITGDGSHTLYVRELEECYHSVNGAVQESVHVFIGAGLRQKPAGKLRLLEVGFGTGLNTFLTLLEARKAPYRVEYYAVELFPLPPSIVGKLNYPTLAGAGEEGLFEALHTAPWNEPVALSDCFTLHKIEGDCRRCELPPSIDLIYFDAFAPSKQPEVWTAELFNKLYAHTAGEGILVTYCAKGSVRRMMQQAGYTVERLPGPPGKREMLRATRLNGDQ
jgi:tRNA U34 5-methylaminomethyl-2-thiouridine-forming methyltransferase MnmC